MNLTSALRTATSSLASHSQQISTISRNISGVGDPNYVRRDTEVRTALYASTTVDTTRYVNQSVYSASITANSNAARAGALAVGVDRIATLQQVQSFAFSPARLLENLKQATEFAAAAPSDAGILTSLVEQARTVSNALNASYDELLNQRAQADKEIVSSVETINTLLSQINDVNEQIVDGTRAGREVFDDLDTRDRLVRELSEEIGINIIPDNDNGIILTTKSGALLFDDRPRDVTFQGTPAFGPSSVGGELRVDGVIVSGPNSPLPIQSGRIAGNLQLRDEVYVEQQNQLDEIARGLVELYSETDQTGGGKPPLAGLFTWGGGPAVPATATLEPGIAATIRVNPLIDPQVGGDPAFLRDGAANGDPDYTYNISGGAGFSDRLFAIANGFDQPLTFDPAAGLPANQSINGFAASTLNSLNAFRAAALDDNDYQTELSQQFSQALQSETGVNLDFEMSRLLEVERAYQATARLLRTVDEMLETLLAAAG